MATSPKNLSISFDISLRILLPNWRDKEGKYSISFLNWCKLVAIRVRFHSEIILWRLQRKQPRLKIYRKKAEKKLLEKEGGEGAAHKRHSIKSVSLKSFAGGIATWCSKFYPSSSFRFLLCRRLCLHCCVDIMFVISSPTVPLSRSESGGDNNAYTFTFPAFSSPLSLFND